MSAYTASSNLSSFEKFGCGRSRKDKTVHSVHHDDVGQRPQRTYQHFSNERPLMKTAFPTMFSPLSFSAPLRRCPTVVMVSARVRSKFSRLW